MAQSDASNFKHYRACALGQSLAVALDSLVSDSTLSGVDADAIMINFDEAINARLRQVHPPFLVDEKGASPAAPAPALVHSKASFEGTLHTYRSVEDVWTFILKPATFRTDRSIQADAVKIVACDAKGRKK